MERPSFSYEASNTSIWSCNLCIRFSFFLSWILAIEDAREVTTPIAAPAAVPIGPNKDAAFSPITPSFFPIEAASSPNFSPEIAPSIPDDIESNIVSNPSATSSIAFISIDSLSFRNEVDKN